MFLLTASFHFAPFISSSTHWQGRQDSVSNTAWSAVRV